MKIIFFLSYLFSIFTVLLNNLSKAHGYYSSIIGLNLNKKYGYDKNQKKD